MVARPAKERHNTASEGRGASRARRAASPGQPSAEELAFAFALRIVKLYQHLSAKKKEFVLSKQVLRSGTSIGANLEESQGAQTPADFQAKISVAYKEARETSYWLRLLRDSGFITEKQFESIHSDCLSLIRILGATQFTMRKKLQQDI